MVTAKGNSKKLLSHVRVLLKWDCGMDYHSCCIHVYVAFYCSFGVQLISVTLHQSHAVSFVET